MLQNFRKSIELIFGHEGGYVNNPNDNGGPTKFGITAATLGAWGKLGRSASASEVKALSLEEADTILSKQFARPIRFNDLPSGLDYAVFDFSVNSGPAQASKTLQRLLGVDIDGNIGSLTLAAIAKKDTLGLIHSYMDARLAFMKSLKGPKGWATFKNGWTSRVKAVRTNAIKMSTNALPEKIDLPTEACAQANPIDTGVLTTNSGMGAAITILGVMGTGVAQAQGILQPIVGTSPYVDNIFTILTVISAALALGGSGFSIYTKRNEIASGVPV